MSLRSRSCNDMQRSEESSFKKFNKFYTNINSVLIKAFQFQMSSHRSEARDLFAAKSEQAWSEYFVVCVLTNRTCVYSFALCKQRKMSSVFEMSSDGQRTTKRQLQRHTRVIAQCRRRVSAWQRHVYLSTAHLLQVPLTLHICAHTFALMCAHVFNLYIYINAELCMCVASCHTLTPWRLINIIIILPCCLPNTTTLNNINICSVNLLRFISPLLFFCFSVFLLFCASTWRAPPIPTHVCTHTHSNDLPN